MKLLAKVILVVMVLYLGLNLCWAEDEGQIIPLAKGGKKIFINFQFSGDSYGLAQYYPNYFRILAQATGKVQVCAWGPELNNLNTATDYFRDSSRYKNGQEPAKGQYEVPEEYYKLTVQCDVEQLTGAVAIPLPFKINGQQSGSLEVAGTKTATVQIMVERYDPVTAAAIEGFLAQGKRTGLQGVGVYIPNVSGGGMIYRQNFENTLVGGAAKSATQALIKRIMADSPSL